MNLHAASITLDNIFCSYRNIGRHCQKKYHFRTRLVLLLKIYLVSYSLNTPHCHSLIYTPEQKKPAHGYCILVAHSPLFLSLHIMKKLLLTLFLSPLITLAQKDSSTDKSIKTQTNKNIFQDASGKVVTPQEYFSLANSGFYIISYTEQDNDTKIYKIDSTDLLKSQHKKKAPESLRDIAGKKVIVPVANKVTVVNFWSTACGPCIEEMDSLNLLVHQFPNVKFIAISPDSLSTTTKFLSTKRFDYNIVSQCQVILSSFYVSAYPTHLVYDKNGVLQNIIIGKAPNLKELVNKLN